MHSYEIEIKSLLGSAKRAEEVRRAMKKADPACGLLARGTQLNHYFKSGSLTRLVEVGASKLTPRGAEKLRDLAAKAKDFSVRTREKDGTEVLLVVKVSIGDDTSANGIRRAEFEERVPMTLKELDALVLSAGFEYEAKWSREREEYVCKGTNITLDKNAGYGWLAEFERVVADESKAANAEQEIRALMQNVGVAELPQARLERMFAFYNAHWPEYYGTEKIFLVE